ncbi:hypothetical protein GCM10025738_30780 [Microbacterium fluvii]
MVSKASRTGTFFAAEKPDSNFQRMLSFTGQAVNVSLTYADAAVAGGNQNVATNSVTTTIHPGKDLRLIALISGMTALWARGTLHINGVCRIPSWTAMSCPGP